MIDPNAVSTIRVGELSPEPFSLTDNVPHEVGTELKRGTIEDLATFISAFIGSTDGVGFRAISVTDGQTLPTTTQQEFILVGKGTYYNVVGGSTIICTEELNAIVSNGSYWFIGVEIPVNVELAGITQFIRDGFINTTPSEDAIYEALSLKANVANSENIANKQNDLTPDGTGTKYPTVDAVNTSTINFNPKNTKIAFLGDSVTAGSGSTGGATSYADILNSFFGFQTYTKLGVSSAVAKPNGVRPQLSTQVSAIPVGTNFITVMIGINDWSENTAIGDVNAVLNKSFGTLDQTLSFAEAFRYNMETIKNSFPDAEIRVILPIKHGSSWVRDLDFKFYIDAEIQIANYLAIPVINAYDASGLMADSPYVPDGIHPNDTGYAMLAKVVKKGIIDNKTTRFSNSIYNPIFYNRVGINIPAPKVPLDVLGQINLTGYLSGGSVSAIRSQLAGGTISAPTTPTSEQSILFLGGAGWTGSSFSGSKVAMVFGTSENWSSSANGTYISLETTPNGGTGRIERFRVANNGNVGINTNAPTEKIHVVGNGLFTGNITALPATLSNQVTTFEQVFTSPDFTGTPTAPTAPTGTNTTRIATTAFAQGIRPYKVYTALLTQVGTDAPTAIVLENTIGAIVWSRSVIGGYFATLSGAFTTNKTSVLITNGSTNSTYIHGAQVSTSNVNVITPADGQIDKATIEIRVYN